MAFKRLRGKTKFMYWKKDTTEEMRDGSLVALNDSGYLCPARNDSLDRIVGVARCNDTIADSHADVKVEVPVELAVEYEIDVDSDGGAADSDIGRFCSIDTAGGNSVNAGDSCAMRADVSDTTSPIIFITGRVSATKIIGTIARHAFVKTVDSLDTGK